MTIFPQRDIKGIGLRLGEQLIERSLASAPTGTSPFIQIQQISHWSVPATALFAFMIIISCLSCNDSNNKALLSNELHF